jgi:hypothetical protein
LIMYWTPVLFRDLLSALKAILVVVSGTWLRQTNMFIAEKGL